MGIQTIPAKEIEKYVGKQNCIIVDLRSFEKYKTGHIQGAIHIPYEEFDEKKYLLYKYNPIVLYCERGSLSLLLARELGKMGNEVISIAGGIRSYRGKMFID